MLAIIFVRFLVWIWETWIVSHIPFLIALSSPIDAPRLGPVSLVPLLDAPPVELAIQLGPPVISYPLPVPIPAFDSSPLALYAQHKLTCPLDPPVVVSRTSDIPSATKFYYGSCPSDFVVFFVPQCVDGVPDTLDTPAGARVDELPFDVPGDNDTLDAIELEAIAAASDIAMGLYETQCAPEREVFPDLFRFLEKTDLAPVDALVLAKGDAALASVLTGVQSSATTSSAGVDVDEPFVWPDYSLVVALGVLYAHFCLVFRIVRALFSIPRRIASVFFASEGSADYEDECEPVEPCSPNATDAEVSVASVSEVDLSAAFFVPEDIPSSTPLRSRIRLKRFDKEEAVVRESICGPRASCGPTDTSPHVDAADNNIDDASFRDDSQDVTVSTVDSSDSKTLCSFDTSSVTVQRLSWTPSKKLSDAVSLSESSAYTSASSSVVFGPPRPPVAICNHEAPVITPTTILLFNNKSFHFGDPRLFVIPVVIPWTLSILYGRFTRREGPSVAAPVSGISSSVGALVKYSSLRAEFAIESSIAAAAPKIFGPERPRTAPHEQLGSNIGPRTTVLAGNRVFCFGDHRLFVAVLTTPWMLRRHYVTFSRAADDIEGAATSECRALVKYVPPFSPTKSLLYVSHSVFFGPRRPPALVENPPITAKDAARFGHRGSGLRQPCLFVTPVDSPWMLDIHYARFISPADLRQSTASGDCLALVRYNPLLGPLLISTISTLSTFNKENFGPVRPPVAVEDPGISPTTAVRSGNRVFCFGTPRLFIAPAVTPWLLGLIYGRLVRRRDSYDGPSSAGSLALVKDCSLLPRYQANKPSTHGSFRVTFGPPRPPGDLQIAPTTVLQFGNKIFCFGEPRLFVQLDPVPWTLGIIYKELLITSSLDAMVQVAASSRLSTTGSNSNLDPGLITASTSAALIRPILATAASPERHTCALDALYALAEGALLTLTTLTSLPSDDRGLLSASSTESVRLQLAAWTRDNALSLTPEIGGDSTALDKLKEEALLTLAIVTPLPSDDTGLLDMATLSASEFEHALRTPSFEDDESWAALIEDALETATPHLCDDTGDLDSSSMASPSVATLVVDTSVGDSSKLPAGKKIRRGGKRRTAAFKRKMHAELEHQEALRDSEFGVSLTSVPSTRGSAATSALPFSPPATSTRRSSGPPLASRSSASHPSPGPSTPSRASAPYPTRIPPTPHRATETNAPRYTPRMRWGGGDRLDPDSFMPLAGERYIVPRQEENELEEPEMPPEPEQLQLNRSQRRAQEREARRMRK